ncbi:MAG: hypothetical protein Q7T83_10345 [Thermodesulfovibrionales bacterium]|nr:hypothetical protein [Thermodesulfovibrionales bacterium]
MDSLHIHHRQMQLLLHLPEEFNVRHIYLFRHGTYKSTGFVHR